MVQHYSMIVHALNPVKLFLPIGQLYLWQVWVCIWRVLYLCDGDRGSCYHSTHERSCMQHKFERQQPWQPHHPHMLCPSDRNTLSPSRHSSRKKWIQWLGARVSLMPALSPATMSLSFPFVDSWWYSLACLLQKECAEYGENSQLNAHIPSMRITNRQWSSRFHHSHEPSPGKKPNHESVARLSEKSILHGLFLFPNLQLVKM